MIDVFTPICGGRLAIIFFISVLVRTLCDLSEIIYFSVDFLSTFAWPFASKFWWIYRLSILASTFSLILKGFNIGQDCQIGKKPYTLSALLQ